MPLGAGGQLVGFIGFSRRGGQAGRLSYLYFASLNKQRSTAPQAPFFGACLRKILGIWQQQINQLTNQRGLYLPNNYPWNSPHAS